ncbi:hypothetical protein K9B33_20810 [Sphingobium sp. 3R8]|uniref:hypothetical protein n=1 Tax=Sphingobium sp. 3R8 TaxID=2874921 RepID=UPI001CCBC5AF|nr:hypothetical protein [Sphingobium sp. 3R8]MBZ9649979.1 hypothetical protein [Sphingobium sp. 3R8]
MNEPIGAVIRATFDGSTPVLPEKPTPAPPPHSHDDGFDDDWPPRPPKDDFSDI